MVKAGKLALRASHPPHAMRWANLSRSGYQQSMPIPYTQHHQKTSTTSNLDLLHPLNTPKPFPLVPPSPAFRPLLSHSLTPLLLRKTPANHQSPHAVAVLRGDSKVGGTVTFEQSSESSPTTISYDISGNDASAERGMHVHQFGDNTNGCTSAGPHFNPFSKTHGAPSDSERHVGDLGNFKTDGQGNAKGSITDEQVKLIGPESVLGRTIVVHAGTDDLGKGGHEQSKTTGNAGGRPACGVIGIAQ